LLEKPEASGDSYEHYFITLLSYFDIHEDVAPQSKTTIQGP